MKLKRTKKSKKKDIKDSIVDECDKREDKTNCYIEYAIKDDNVDLCYFAEDKNTCYKEFAIKTLSFRACGRIKNKKDCKSELDCANCYYNVAVGRKMTGRYSS